MSEQQKQLKSSLQVLNEFPAEQYIPLVPVTILEASSITKLATNLVKLSDNPVDQDIYVHEWHKKKVNGEWANDRPKLLGITRKGLSRLMAAANIQQLPSSHELPSSCGRCAEMARLTRIAPVCGGCESKDDVAVKAAIRVPCPDGTYRIIGFTKEMRMADEKDRMQSDKQFKQMFAYRTEHAESKAVNRCVRYALGLKSTYLPEEIKNKTFVVVYPVPNLDDIDIKKAMIARMTGAVDMLYDRGAVPMISTGEPVLMLGEDDVPTVEAEHAAAQETSTEPVEMAPNICRMCQKEITDNGNWKAEDIIKYSKTMTFPVSGGTVTGPFCGQCQKEQKKSRRAG
jgi:hypothetical protein